MNNGVNKQWVKLECVVLSEIGQTEKDRYCMVSLTCGISKIKEGNT